MQDLVDLLERAAIDVRASRVDLDVLLVALTQPVVLVTARQTLVDDENVVVNMDYFHQPCRQREPL